MLKWIKTVDGYKLREYQITKSKAWNKTIWLISNNGETFSKKNTLKEAKFFVEQWLVHNV